MGIILVEINVQEQLIINAKAAMTLVPDIHQRLLPAAIVQKAMIQDNTMWKSVLYLSQLFRKFTLLEC